MNKELNAARGIVRGLMLSIPFWLIVALALWLAGCGGGGGSGPVNSQGVPIVSSVGSGGCSAAQPFSACGPGGQQICAPGYTGIYPNCVAPPGICAVNAPEADCTCPPADPANSLGVCTLPPPPACAAYAPIAACVCVAPNTANNLGVCMPPVATCPSNTYGTYPNCTPIPSCSAIVGGYWGGNACECPASESGTYPACIVPVCGSNATGTYPNCTCPAGDYWGGPAVGCLPDTQALCAAPLIWVGACIAAPVVTISASANPTTVADDGGVSGQGCTPLNSCTSINFTVTSSYAQDSFFCADASNNAIYPGFAVSIGPFSQAQEGSQSYVVTCKDIAGLSVSATAVFTVVPVAVVVPPVPDTLTCAVSTDSGGNPDSVCSYTSGVLGDACYVWDMSATSGAYALTGGGQGNSSGTVLGPAILQPTTFALQCTLSTGPQATVSP